MQNIKKSWEMYLSLTTVIYTSETNLILTCITFLKEYDQNRLWQP